MIYELTISTLTTHTAAVPKKTVWKMEKGIINALRVYFPAGSANLLHLYLSHEGVQFFPKSEGSFSGHAGLFEHLGVGFPLLHKPYELVVYSWNLSSRFTHTVYLYIDLSRAGVLVR